MFDPVLDLGQRKRQLRGKTEQRLRITVVASMRNEGPFIVEWVTWYRMLGFTDIVVVTNNCNDRSPELLDALEAAGWVKHIRHDVEPGQRVTFRKLAAAKEHKSVRRADWLLVCDVDEFLVIHKGSGKIHELIGKTPKDVPFLAMALNWRVFGTCGVDRFDDTPVHQQFALALPQARAMSKMIKMLHRHPRWFLALGEHGPRGWNLDRFGRKPSDDGMYLVNALGETVPDYTPGRPYTRSLNRRHATHEVAQMNHYMLRSAETFSLKAGTKSPVGLIDRYTEAYRAKAEAATTPDSSAFRYADDFTALHAHAMALPDVARLHALCCADHLRLIAEKHGRRADQDARWHDFMARAAALAIPPDGA